jgi:malonyl-CoA O-methyltransferase
MTTLDQQQIYRRRQRAAKTYDQAAIVQREIFNRLIERLDYMLIKPESVLDLGSGTGYGTDLLQQLYPNAKVLSVDISESLLQQQNTPYRICSSVQRLPLRDHSQQLVVANLLLHWVNDPQILLKEIARVLDPKGVLLLTAMGLDTLKECRSAFAQIDQSPHVHDFLDMHDVGDSLLQLGFTDPVVDMQTLTVNYKSLEQLFNDLRHLGATNAHSDRRRGLMGKNQWQKMLAAYEMMKNDNTYPGTYEIIFGHAWGVRTQRQENGETSITLSALEKMLGSE